MILVKFNVGKTNNSYFSMLFGCSSFYVFIYLQRNIKEPFISRYYQMLKFDPKQFPGVHKYKVRLYSKASGSHLRILGRRQIDSLGTMNSADCEYIQFPYIALQFQIIITSHELFL